MASPVLGSFASNDAAEKRKGTEQEAALRRFSLRKDIALLAGTYTADQINTLGAET